MSIQMLVRKVSYKNDAQITVEKPNRYCTVSKCSSENYRKNIPPSTRLKCCYRRKTLSNFSPKKVSFKFVVHSIAKKSLTKEDCIKLLLKTVPHKSVAQNTIKVLLLKKNHIEMELLVETISEIFFTSPLRWKTNQILSRNSSNTHRPFN